MSEFEGDLIIGLQHGELSRFSVFDRSFSWRVRFGTDGAPQRLVRFPYGVALTVSRGGLYVLDAHSGELRDQFSSGVVCKVRWPLVKTVGSMRAA